MNRKHTLLVSAFLSFIILASLFTTLMPVQAFNAASEKALQTTPVVTVIVPTVIIPDSGGDGNPTPEAFYISLFIWGGLILMFFVFLALMIGRSRSEKTEPRITIEHHDHQG